MKNSLIVSMLVISGSLFLYWNSRKSESTKPVVAVEAPVEKPSPVTETESVKSEEPVQAKADLDSEALKKIFPGYWVSKSSVDLRNSKRKIQLYFTEVKNPELHDGKVIEGLVFTFDETNPAMQSIAKLTLNGISGQQVNFKVEMKDISKYYADGRVYEEDRIANVAFSIEESELIVTADNSYNEKVFTARFRKLDTTDILSKFKGRWLAIRKSDNKKISLNFGGIGDFSDDFGSLKIKGDCSTEGKFKVRPVDEKISLVTVGSASCSFSTNVFKSIVSDNQLETIVYSPYNNEPYELNFKKD